MLDLVRVKKGKEQQSSKVRENNRTLFCTATIKLEEQHIDKYGTNNRATFSFGVGNGQPTRN
jgi:hypothetical protein